MQVADVTGIPSVMPYIYMFKTMKFSVPVLAPRQPNLVNNHKSNNTNYKSKELRRDGEYIFEHRLVRGDIFYDNL